MQKKHVEIKKSKRKKKKDMRIIVKKLAYVILFILGMSCMMWSVYVLHENYKNYKASEQEYDKLQLFVSDVEDDDSLAVPSIELTMTPTVTPSVEPTVELTKEPTVETTKESVKEVEKAGIPKPKKVDWDGLLKVNEDIVGWIEIAGTKINYPVLRGHDNEEYIHTSVARKYAYAGCIFMDAANDADFSDYNTIIYGHNMRNGSMFGTLDYYSKDSYYIQHPYIWIYTPKGNHLYQIYAIYQTTATSNTYSLTTKMGEYISWKKRMFQKGEKIEEISFENTITLSTCTKGKGRFVVQAEEIVYNS